MIKLIEYTDNGKADPIEFKEDASSDKLTKSINKDISMLAQVKDSLKWLKVHEGLVDHGAISDIENAISKLKSI